ncbi:transketolase [Bradyrhizobium jicamae]|uniref:Transketolase n=1 Tax=Bradyrhizobium jicamae TaxID=280332 RepID=A0ABS5FK96_9BRAD|nr:transketolase [Bradyrhizobium jicamae]MBR0797211.1 transketolase [Bradyrhizobium jicamae]
MSANASVSSVSSLSSAEIARRQADAIRFLAVDAILKAGEGHQGVPLGMAEIATALFTRHLKFNPNDPLWPDRDRFVVSNGHGSMLLYALLHLTGYEKISLSQVMSFRELGSHCAGHPEYDPAAGIETTTGPLGQGIANALGMAIAEAQLRARFGSEIVDHMTYAFVGDGCLQEGVGQEVISLAGHLRLGHLVFVWDDNRITDDGATSLSISEDVAERFRVAGWHVAEVDGHDIEAVSDALAKARKDDRPSLIACRTTIAKGVRRLEGQRGGHSGKLFDTDRQEMSDRLGWPATRFTVPNEVAAAWRDAGTRSRDEYDSWQRRVATLDDATRTLLGRTVEGRLPEGWRDVTSTYRAQAIARKKPAYSIETSGEVASALYDLMPDIMTCCADLEAPTNHKRQLEAFSAANPRGRYVHCGVREHAMGSLANGMAAHGGVIPLAVTYFAFADYERPAMRMAALMGLPVKFIFSHDSIGIGKNGPTHQPVEILASLRAMPNMLVLRPADAAEMAECWEIMLEHTTGPVSLVCARQQLDQLRSDTSTDNQSRRGAYVLAEADGERRVTLLATGSEVALAKEARALLQARGVPTAVVSMPCWELFEAQDKGYRSSVLGAGTVRVGVEAAMKFGWERWLGHDGAFVGMPGFGASGPADALYRHFNITTEAIVAAALASL